MYGCLAQFDELVHRLILSHSQTKVFPFIRQRKLKSQETKLTNICSFLDNSFEDVGIGVDVGEGVLTQPETINNNNTIEANVTGQRSFDLRFIPLRIYFISNYGIPTFYTTSKLDIIPLSSCSSLWQWIR